MPSRRGANESHTQPSTHPLHTPHTRLPGPVPSSPRPRHRARLCRAQHRCRIEQRQMSQATAARDTQQGPGAWSFMEQLPIGAGERNVLSSWMRTLHHVKSALHRRRLLVSHDRARSRKRAAIPNNRGDGASDTEDSSTPMCEDRTPRQFILYCVVWSKPAPGIRCRSGEGKDRSLSCQRVISCPAVVE